MIAVAAILTTLAAFFAAFVADAFAAVTFDAVASAVVADAIKAFRTKDARMDIASAPAAWFLMAFNATVALLAQFPLCIQRK